MAGLESRRETTTSPAARSRASGREIPLRSLDMTFWIEWLLRLPWSTWQAGKVVRSVPVNMPIQYSGSAPGRTARKAAAQRRAGKEKRALFRVNSHDRCSVHSCDDIASQISNYSIWWARAQEGFTS